MMRCLLFMLVTAAHLWLLSGFYRSDSGDQRQVQQPLSQIVTLTTQNDASLPLSDTAKHHQTDSDRVLQPEVPQPQISQALQREESPVKTHTDSLARSIATTESFPPDANNPKRKDIVQAQQAPSPTLVHASYLSAPNPPYPEQARRLGYQGKVLLNLLVGVNGSVERVRLLQSSGYPILDEAAINGLSDWLFIPTKLDGKPVAYWYAQKVAFHLTPAGVAGVRS